MECRCRKILENVDMFNSAPEDLINDVLTKLEFQVYFKGDFIVRAGLGSLPSIYCMQMFGRS